jgi:hypothetical protein
VKKWGEGLVNSKSELLILLKIDIIKIGCIPLQAIGFIAKYKN